MSKILENLMASRRLPVLFIGSGLSRRYIKDFPVWEDLLEELREKIKISKTAYSAMKHEIKSQNPDISRGKLNQKLASYLHTELLKKIKKDAINLSELFTQDEINSCINDDVNYFKLLTAKSFFNYNLREEESEEIELLKKVGKNVSMVFTTNYDTFLEDIIFPDFKVYVSQNKYYFRTNNGYGELFKIHGCVKEPNGIIIDEKDYDKFNNSLKLISSKLLNSLLDYPVIFLGYSFEDENIKKIIADFVNSFDREILEEIKKFMVLVVYEKGQDELIEGEKQFIDETTGKSITLSTIKTDNFKKIYSYIEKLQPCATTYELRKYKTMLAEFVSKCAKGEKTIYVQELESANDKAEALYIGKREAIESIDKSVDIYTNIDIFQKALNGEKFDYDSFASKWYDNKSIRANEYTPVFLIKSKMGIDFESTCKKFKENYKDRKEYFEGECFYDVEEIDKKTKVIKGVKKIKGYGYSELCKIYDSLVNEGKNSKSINDKLCPMIINSMFLRKISLENFKELIEKLLKEQPQSIEYSPFRKAVCYCWYVEYEKNKSTEG